jgi:NAD(P)-dependent dehydrogenase (short-subunit alcohol dehydrogenase family)
MSKVWFITGSSRGLGRELAKAVLASGDLLVATARQPEQLRDILEPHADRAIGIALDVTRVDQVKQAIEAAVGAFGRIDVLVNNAGYANTSAIEDVPEADFRAQLETNFFGTFHVTRAALPVMRSQGSGHIIQISSMGGRTGTAGLGAYQSAKWAVEGFSEVLLREVSPLGIKVTLVEPGGFRTDWGGASMRIDVPSEPYQQTVGRLAEHLRKDSGSVRGDPARAALAILKIAAVEQPPLRLLLGTDAVFLADLVTRGRLAEDAAWHALSSSTDLPGLEPFGETAVARLLLAQRQ